MSSLPLFHHEPAARVRRHTTVPCARLVCVLLVALLAAACTDDGSRPDPGGSAASSWRQLAGGVGEPLFRSVWGASADTIYATGTDHPLLGLLDGVWGVVPLPAQPLLSTVWGFSARDIYAAGRDGAAFHFDGQTWSSIAAEPGTSFVDLWGTDTGDVFASVADAAGAAVACYRDGGWNRLDGEFPGEIWAIWAAGPQAIYVAGDDAYVGRYDGVIWKPISKLSGFVWFDAWGASENDVFFVGDAGHIARWASSTLREMASPTTAMLRSIFGLSPDNVFAVGNGGTIIHFDGTTWVTMPSGTVRDLYAVWGFADGRAIALGDFGTVLQFDGTAWHAAFVGQPTVFEDAFGFSTDEVFFAGHAGPDGIVRHVDGREWAFPGETLLSVWGFAPDDVFVCGELGAVHRFDGATWTKLASGTFAELSGGCGARGGDTRRVFVVGVHGTIRYADDPFAEVWSPMIPPNNGVFDLRAVWAATPDAAFAVGPTGTILRLRDEGSIRWSTEVTGSTAGFAAITGRSANDVVAVSDDGRVFHFGGERWAVISIPPTGPLLDASYSPYGVVLAVSSRPRTATLIHFGQSRLLQTPYLGPLTCGWTTGKAAFVAGGEGAVLEYRW